MLSGGDELGRTQKGNNNAYCQDNEISWYQWDLDAEDQAFLEFVQKLIAIRKDQLVIHRKTFFKGSGADGAMKDIFWLNVDGKVMEEKDWTDASKRVLGVLLDGSQLVETDKMGRTQRGNTLLVLLNAHHEDVPFVLPDHDDGDFWRLVLDTSETIKKATFPMSKRFTLKARSIVLLQLDKTV